MTRTSLRALLIRAARMLDDAATETHRMCEIPGTSEEWACPDCTRQPCRTRKLYEREKLTAKQLRDAAAKGIRG